MKSKSSKQNNLFVIFIFGVIVLTSPWLWILRRNFSVMFPPEVEVITFSNQQLVDQINTLRGELVLVNTPPLIARVTVNKATFYSFEIAKRYLESFDFQFLFFLGDLNITKSTHTTGMLFLVLLPLIIYGIFSSSVNSKSLHLQRWRKVTLIIFLLTPVPAAFLVTHYETILRIPLFLTLSYFSAIGFVKIIKNKKALAVILVLVFLFEFFRFTHDFYKHYPRRMGEEIFLK